MKIKPIHIILALLLIVPSIMNLAVPFYNSKLPELFELPFFYWFQSIWLVICSFSYLCYSFIINKKEKKHEAEVV